MVPLLPLLHLCMQRHVHGCVYASAHTHSHTYTHMYTYTYTYTRTHMQSEADMLQLLGQLSAANAITDTQMNKVCVRACMFRSVCDLRCLNPEAPVQSKTWNISRGFNVAVHYYIIKLHLAPLQPCLLMHALSP